MRMREGAHLDCRHLDRAKMVTNSTSLCSPCAGPEHLISARIHASQWLIIHATFIRQRALDHSDCDGCQLPENICSKETLVGDATTIRIKKEVEASHQLLETRQGTFNGGLVIALVEEFCCKLAARVRPECQAASGRGLASFKFLVLRRPNQQRSVI